MVIYSIDMFSHKKTYQYHKLILDVRFTFGNVIGMRKYKTSIGISKFKKNSRVAQWYKDVPSKHKVAGSTPGPDQNFENFFFFKIKFYIDILYVFQLPKQR